MRCVGARDAQRTGCHFEVCIVAACRIRAYIVGESVNERNTTHYRSVIYTRARTSLSTSLFRRRSANDQIVMPCLRERPAFVSQTEAAIACRQMHALCPFGSAQGHGMPVSKVRNETKQNAQSASRRARCLALNGSESECIALDTNAHVTYAHAPAYLACPSYSVRSAAMRL